MLKNSDEKLILNRNNIHVWNPCSLNLLSLIKPSLYQINIKNCLSSSRIRRAPASSPKSTLSALTEPADSSSPNPNPACTIGTPGSRSSRFPTSSTWPF